MEFFQRPSAYTVWTNPSATSSPFSRRRSPHTRCGRRQIPASSLVRRALSIAAKRSRRAAHRGVWFRHVRSRGIPGMHRGIALRTRGGLCEETPRSRPVSAAPAATAEGCQTANCSYVSRHSRSLTARRKRCSRIVRGVSARSKANRETLATTRCSIKAASARAT